MHGSSPPERPAYATQTRFYIRIAWVASRGAWRTRSPVTRNQAARSAADINERRRNAGHWHRIIEHFSPYGLQSDGLTRGKCADGARHHAARVQPSRRV